MKNCPSLLAQFSIQNFIMPSSFSFIQQWSINFSSWCSTIIYREIYMEQKIVWVLQRGYKGWFVIGNRQKRIVFWKKYFLIHSKIGAKANSYDEGWYPLVFSIVFNLTYSQHFAKLIYTLHLFQSYWRGRKVMGKWNFWVKNLFG